MKNERKLLKSNNYKLMLDVKRIIKKMYLRNNINFSKIRFIVKADYKNKRIIIKFKKLR